MKKSVIILIGIIYVLGIVLVNAFGLKMAEFQTKVYVDSVSFVNNDIYTQEVDGEEIKKVDIYLSERNIYQLEWEYTPDNATETDVIFTYDETKNIGTVDENGLITFYKKGVLVVYIRTVDGTSKSDSIKFIVR